MCQFQLSNICFGHSLEANGIPEFWLTAMKNVETINEMIQVIISCFSMVLILLHCDLLSLHFHTLWGCQGPH